MEKQNDCSGQQEIMNLRLKLIDRYIIRKFLGTFFYTIILIISVAVIFDLTEKVDDIFEKNIPVSELIFDYYLNFIPYFANLFTPLFAFISVVFFTSKMANQTEIVAILSSGVSFKRLLRPYILAASLIGIFSFLLSSFVIPPANAKRLKFEYKFLKFNFNRNYSNLHRQITPGTFIYLETFTQESKTGFRFTLEEMKNNKIHLKLSSDYIRWDSTTSHWILENYVIREFNGKNETLRKGATLDTVLKFRPEEFSLADDDVQMMNLFELNKFIESERQKGSEFIDYYLLEKHRRMANPVAIIILTLIAVPLAGRKVRGGVGLHIGIGIGISFGYVMMMQISSVFATEGGLSPEIASWIPNCLFFLLALYLLKKAPK
jgi:lipopolysaccharide export system permease protein